jgi:hypothetical protein
MVSCEVFALYPSLFFYHSMGNTLGQGGCIVSTGKKKAGSSEPALCCLVDGAQCA